MHNNPFQNVEFEITIKNQQDLEKAVLLIIQNKISRISLTNKQDSMPHPPLVLELKKRCPNLQINSTYSIKYNYSGSSLQAKTNFEQFYQQSLQAGTDQILVVSGSIKKQTETLAMLEFIKQKNLVGIDFWVAYNPFLITKSSLDQEIEDQRLAQKLSYGFVKGVYLQIGTNLEMLETGIKKVLEIGAGKENLPQIRVCMLQPTAGFLQNWSFRPWAGVFLNTDYLSGQSNAQNKNQEIKKLIVARQINELITLMPFNQQQIDIFKSRL